MQVTGVCALTKTKYKVELDGQFAFVLYKGELSRFGIREQGELSPEVYRQILEDVLLKRAKLYAMHLLADMGRSEQQLRTKLTKALYPTEVVEQAIAYVKSFGYLNDDVYARQLIESRKGKKSRKELLLFLQTKGLEKETIDRAMEEVYGEEAEVQTILSLIRKKKADPLHDSPQQLHKLYGYLARKGFRYEEIRQAIQNYQEENT